MELKIGRRDLIWGYFAQFFSMASGVIVLPLILKLLSPEEIGLNYLMLTIGSLVTLFDFGFAPQFGRNITYIFSGSQKLLREGVDVNNSEKEINYRLLYVMIKTAKYLYARLSLIVFLLLISGGTFYIYKITNGFTTVNNSFVIWILYCVSVYFNMYYAYYSSLLNGKGMVTEYRKALVFSKLLYTLVALLLLLLNFGLISIVIANFITPFVVKLISHKYFFSAELNSKLSEFSVQKKEISDLLNILWFNARKLGLVYAGSFAITKIGMFIAGLYLPLETIGSYGLMLQLVSLISVLSTTISTLYQPRLSSLRILNSKTELLREFSYTVVIFKILFIIGSLILIFSGNKILSVFGSATLLPEIPLLALYCLVVFLETNHSLFSSFLVTNNEIPFVKSTLLAGLFITIFTYIFLRFSTYGLVSVIFVPAIVQMLYNNWKWPYEVSVFFKVSYFELNRIGFVTLIKHVEKIFKVKRKQ